MSVSSRFAPSPTGYLHIGGARTALYAWLYARHCSGEFRLRVEDTDLERSTEESKLAILESMEWLGLYHDGEVVYQTKRFDKYQEGIQRLLDEGRAYRCYCSKARLESLREQQMAAKQKPRYDGKCREIDSGDSVSGTEDGGYVVRFKTPESGDVTFIDSVRGEVTFDNSELDDLIIARSDGVPTYNFTVVVDDADMNISHVIRGDDHINNTPRQIHIFEALGYPVPTYAHLPTILGPDGKRFSKRHGAVSVLQYRDDGILPEALVNYLVRLGWSHGDQEIFSQSEMIDFFDFDHVSHSAAAFDYDKLLWLNQHYIKSLDSNRVAEVLGWQMERAGIDVQNGPSLESVVLAQRDRCKTMVEMVEKSEFWYVNEPAYDPKAVSKHLKPAIQPALELFIIKLSQLSNWQASDIHELIISTAESSELKLGKFAQPVRVAVTGGTISPSLDVTLELLGREKVLQRLERALSLCGLGAEV